MSDGIETITIETAQGSAPLTPEELQRMASGALDEGDAMAGARTLIGGLIEDVIGPSRDDRRRVVEFRMVAEDFRALIARCLLFAATKDALAAVRLEVTPFWVTASATDGYTLGVQKIRCEAETEGIFALDIDDARRMLQLIPRPRKDDQLGDVVIDFVTGQDAGPVNMRYEGDEGRAITYGCPGAAVSSLIDYRKLLDFDRHAPASDPRFAVDPQFLAKVAKAELAAKDQIPFVVRWYLRPSKSFGENPLVVAYFSVAPTHDEFVAVLTPTGVNWDARDDLGAIVDRFSQAQPVESERLRPLQHSLEAD